MVVCAREGCEEPARPRTRLRGAAPKYCLRHSKDRKPYVFDPEVPGPVSDRSYARRGDGYVEFAASEWPGRIAGKTATQEHVATVFGVTRVAVTQWFAAWREDQRLESQRDGWVRDPEVQACLGDSVEAFKAFRGRYFPSDRHGKPMLTEPFHLEWIEALYDCYRNGGEVAVVAPPRHGKSELLIAFMCWLIVKHPNIAVIWVGKSADLAEKMVGSVMQSLEHTNLAAEVLGPGRAFKPAGRAGTKWTRKEFEVANRTIKHKSPTMVALGVGTTLLGRDADFIVGDDVEDHESSQQPGRRESTKLWWSKDVQSRKEEHTGVAYIGSRQHPDDLIGMFVTNDEWRTMVYPAHDPGCHLPWDEAYVDAHQTCVLFPAVRSFRWLLKQRKAMKNDALFEMNYQNNPKPEGLMVFDREAMEGCLDVNAHIGKVPAWPHRLVAGFDPGGGAGNQAAVLWAVEVGGNKWQLVDLDSTQGGGTVHLRHLLTEWTRDYPALGVWVFEENYLKDTLEVDREITELRMGNSLQFKTHHTGQNKWDFRHGVYAMVPMYNERRIVLPWSAESKPKVSKFVDEHASFDRQAAQTARWPKPYDLVMAAWFPLKTIRQWQWSQSNATGGVNWTSTPSPTLKASSFGRVNRRRGVRT